MSLKPLPPYIPAKPVDASGRPALLLAPLNLNGAPADVPLVLLVVAHVVDCLDCVGRVANSTEFRAMVSIDRDGHGLVGTAHMVFTKAPSPGTPDEGERRALDFVHFRRGWATYLHDKLATVQGAPELIICPVEASFVGDVVVRHSVEPLLANDYFTLVLGDQTPPADCMA